jgi:hypothetical protein
LDQRGGLTAGVELVGVVNVVAPGDVVVVVELGDVEVVVVWVEVAGAV